MLFQFCPPAIRQLALLGLVVAAMTASAEAQSGRLYFFTQAGCEPCARMEPSVDALARSGCALTKIDVRLQPEWAQHFQVTQTPTTIVVVENRIVASKSGWIPADQLAQLAAMANQRPVGEPPATFTRAAVTDTPPASAPQSQQLAAASPSTNELESTRHQGTRQPANAAEQSAMAATVRLRLENDHEISFATGTVIHSHGPEALVLTCGHIFRDSAGRGVLTADIGLDQAVPKTVPAQLLQFDADSRDVALVILRATDNLPAVRLADSNWPAQQGTEVFSIGCDRGDLPTIRRSQIKNVACYDDAEKYDIYGRPVVGRSGGGLFNSTGELVGVCNAAAVEVDEGIYSAIENVYWQVAQAKLTNLFSSGPRTDIVQTDIQPIAPNQTRPQTTLASLPAATGSWGTQQVNSNSSADAAPRRGSEPFVLHEGGRWEAIVVLRNLDAPHESRTFTVSEPDLGHLSALLGADPNFGNSARRNEMAAIPAPGERRREMPELAVPPGDRTVGVRAQSPR